MEGDDLNCKKKYHVKSRRAFRIAIKFHTKKNYHSERDLRKKLSVFFFFFLNEPFARRQRTGKKEKYLYMFEEKWPKFYFFFGTFFVD